MLFSFRFFFCLFFGASFLVLLLNSKLFVGTSSHPGLRSWHNLPRLTELIATQNHGCAKIRRKRRKKLNQLGKDKEPLPADGAQRGRLGVLYFSQRLPTFSAPCRPTRHYVSCQLEGFHQFFHPLPSKTDSVDFSFSDCESWM